MTLPDDHGELATHATLLVERLETVRSMFVGGRVGYEQHTKWAARCGLLAEHLGSALLLTEHRRYAPALVAVRTGLEHHLVDRLLFLANRYQQVYSIKKPDIDAEVARLTLLQAGPRPDIAKWWVSNGKMNVVVRGLFREGSIGRGQTLSPYYVAAGQYDPFTGRPRNVHRLAGAFMPIGQRRKWAEEARSVWESLFVYEKLRRNLLLNRLLTSGQALQVDVHYGFLSAFAHAIDRGYDLVYGRNIPSTRGGYDHYSSELVLLYVATLAAEELSIFVRAAARAPRLRLADLDVLRHELDAARSASAHLWFLTGEPLLFDRINEVHTRLVRRRHPWGPPPIDPALIPSARVRYYANPLVRLVELHRGSRELSTGLGFSAPFPRPDAINRI